MEWLPVLDFFKAIWGIYEAYIDATKLPVLLGKLPTKVYLN
jgi:hypothetical protein